MTTIRRPVSANHRATVIAFGNHKGGSGKTTSLFGLATLLLRMHKKVLLIDMDPQENLTRRANPEGIGGNIAQALGGPTNSWSPAQFLSAICECKIDCIKQPLDLVPGSVTFEDTLINLSHGSRLGVSQSESKTRLRRGLDDPRRLYDYILIDTPPAAESMLTDLVLEAADVLMIPVDGYDAIDGMANLLSTVQLQNDDRKGKRDLLKTFVYCPHLVGSDGNSPDQSDWYQMIKKAFPYHFAKTVIRHSSSVRKTSSAGKGYSGFSMSSRLEFKALYEELFNGLLKSPLIPLTEWMAHPGNTTPEKMRVLVQEGRAKEARKVKVTTGLRFLL
jgi:cellulose biosynthesis protein BcsQ